MKYWKYILMLFKNIRENQSIFYPYYRTVRGDLRTRGIHVQCRGRQKIILQYLTEYIEIYTYDA